MFYYLVRGIVWTTFRVIFLIYARIIVEGKENVPEHGGVIIAPNHVSFADPPAIGVTLKRNAWWVGTDEMFGYRFVGKIALALRGIPIRQDSPDRKALKKCLSVLKSGNAIVIFPEGHVSKDGIQQPIQPGPAMLAISSGVPIVPVGIVNSDMMMPPHQWKLHRINKPIIIRYGKPISPEELSGGLSGRAGVDHGAALIGRTLLELTRAI